MVKLVGLVVLHLIASSGGTVTANNLREKLRIKAVSTAAEHMALAERAGLVAFVPILTDNPARQAINPRKVYAADTAMIAALSPEPQPDRDRLFETMIFNHLRRSCSSIRYTTEQGGCDFVATDSEGAIRSDMPAGGFSHAVGVFVGATGECGFT